MWERPLWALSKGAKTKKLTAFLNREHSVQELNFREEHGWLEEP